MGINLFGGSESESELECPKIEVDKEFARRYEHNKKREDLHRYEELKKRGQIPRGDDSEGSSSSSSSSDGEDDLLANSKKDLKFFDALIKVRKKDPSLKNKDVKLFDSDDESDGENDQKEKGKKNKAMYLKDVVAKQLIEDGPDFDQDDEVNFDNNNNDNINKLVYDEEQERIRNAFLEAVKDDKGGDELEGPVLTLKSKRKEEEAESGGDDDEEELKKKVDEYFGYRSGGDEDENSRFLKDYFVNKMWMDKRGPHSDDDDEIERISEDGDEVEKQEEFEYRYQEGAGDQVLGHSREVVGSVRKRESSRRQQRRHKEEREEAARLEREEELRRLKNVKRKEMESRVRRIMEIAGIKEGDRSAPLSAKELEDEFDPEEYDRMMEKAFGDEYYAVDAADNDDDGDTDDDDADKPNFDAEDEELGLSKGWDGRHGGSLEEDEDEEDEEGKKKKLAIFEKAKEAMMDDYYKLDYEDTIGDLKTRFKYTNTKGKRYGLSAAAILLMEDKELNQYVPMNKIAPYKEKEWKVPEAKRYEMKLKVNELIRGKRDQGKSRKEGFGGDKASISSVAVEEEPNGGPSGLSKTAKRRKKQSDLKLSTSRLMAYGKTSSSKHKKKKSKH